MTAERGPDPGAVAETQAERTELAWVRTGLACAGLAAVATRLAGPDLSLGAALALAAVVAVPALGAAWLRVGGLRARPPAPPRHVAVAVLAGTVAAVDALVLAMLLT
ncbi:MAG TPA: DUF202 domain-containing protein [Acidimicrobiales bacterium]